MGFMPFIAAVALALPHVAAAAQSGAVQPTVPDKPEKKVCRTVQATGSIMPKRECHTVAQWHAIDGTNEDAARTMRDRSDNHH